METAELGIINGKNFSGAQVGALDALGNYQFFHPLGKGRGFPGKLFLKEPLAMTGMEVSMNKLPAGQSVPFYHQHREHEELYIFLRGKGQFMVDDTVIDVQEGTVIRVAPEGMRTWRNHSEEDLFYIVVQAREGSLAASQVEDGIVRPEKVSWPA